MWEQIGNNHDLRLPPHKMKIHYLCLISVQVQNHPIISQATRAYDMNERDIAYASQLDA